MTTTGGRTTGPGLLNDGRKFGGGAGGRGDPIDPSIGRCENDCCSSTSSVTASESIGPSTASCASPRGTRRRTVSLTCSHQTSPAVASVPVLKSNDLPP